MNGKKLVTLGLALSLLLAGTACAATADNTTAPAAETQVASDTHPIAMHITYPEQYLLTYEVVGEKGVITTVTQGRDAAGNLYCKDSSTETLYWFNGSSYEKYSFDAEGLPVRDGEEKYTQAHAEQAAMLADDYAKKACSPLIASAKYVEAATVLGHASAAYQVGVKVFNFAYSVDFAQDDESGICLYWHASTSLDDSVAADADGDFTCTRFDVADVTLPGVAELSAR